MKPHTAMKNFDPSKYQGMWYELAKIPTLTWEKECKWATANYVWNPDKNNILITNTCYTDRSSYEKEGMAYPTSEPGKFVVTFKDVPGYKAPYWVHITDYNTYAIVGGPGDNYLWVLTRESWLPPDVRVYIASLVRAEGYDPKRLVWNYIPMPQNIESLTVKNKEYRRVHQTTPSMQLVFMTLKPGEFIEEEMHKGSQFFRVEQGTARMRVNGKVFLLTKDEYIIVPDGIVHYLENASKNENLSLYTIYTPPEHEPFTVKRRQISL